ncbi:MAG: mechanosensitive ion channel domain-containing protein [Planctomycetota bacterium]
MVSERFGPIINVVDKLEVFLGRRPVQIQLLALFVALVVSFALVRLFWWWALPRLMGLVDSTKNMRLRRFLAFVVHLADASSFPVLCLALVGPAAAVIESFGTPGGLLLKFSWVLSTLLLMRVFRTCLFECLEKDLALQFHRRLVAPLFFTLVLLGIFGNLTDLSQVYDINLVTAFGTPLKLGPVCIATLGLYFLGLGLCLCEELIHQFVKKQTRMDPGRAKATLTLIRYLLLIAGVIAAISQFELEPQIVAAISGGLSIGVGFGLREILSNFISGFLLLVERTLNPGDVIDMEDQISVVEKLSVRATTVRTLNNEELVIPNQTFLTASFKTYTGSDRTVRVPITLQTDCDINPDRVCELLVETAVRHEQVLSSPSPSVFLLEYANNVASFQLNIWLANPLDSPRVTSEVKLLVWDAFQEHNIKLPFPEMDLHFPASVSVQATNDSDRS